MCVKNEKRRLIVREQSKEKIVANARNEESKSGFDEYGNRKNGKESRAEKEGQVGRGSTSSLKSRISSRILKTEKKISVNVEVEKEGKNKKNLVENKTSNVGPSKNFETCENLPKSTLNPIHSSKTHNVDLNFPNQKKFQTSIESKKVRKGKQKGRPSLFEESESLKTNIKLTESNVQPKKEEDSGEKLLVKDSNFIKALKHMKQSITKMKKIGACELKNKNDCSWGDHETGELAAIKAGLGGDVSRVQMISNFSVMSDFDKSGDTLLNLEKYLGGLSSGRGRPAEDLKMPNNELPKLKFLLEKVRLVLGKGRSDETSTEK